MRNKVIAITATGLTLFVVACGSPVVNEPPPVEVSPSDATSTEGDDQAEPQPPSTMPTEDEAQVISPPITTSEMSEEVTDNTDEAEPVLESTANTQTAFEADGFYSLIRVPEECAVHRISVGTQVTARWSDGCKSEFDDHTVFFRVLIEKAGDYRFSTFPASPFSCVLEHAYNEIGDLVASTTPGPVLHNWTCPPNLPSMKVHHLEAEHHLIQVNRCGPQNNCRHASDSRFRFTVEEPK